RELPLGTGPFVLHEWKQGSRIMFTRNTRYWDPERPFLDRLEVDLLVPDDVAALRFLRGEIDRLEWPSSDDFLRFAESPAWQPYIDRTVDLETEVLMLNTTRSPFDDRRVRRAMNYAINKEEVLRVLNGRGVVANGWLPPRFPGHQKDRAPYPYDPE